MRTLWQRYEITYNFQNKIVLFFKNASFYIKKRKLLIFYTVFFHLFDKANSLQINILFAFKLLISLFILHEKRLFANSFITHEYSCY